MDAAKTGALIARARKEKGLTQGELAQRLHVSTQAVSKWERGLNFPDIILLDPLAQELEVTVSELLSGQQADPAEETVLRDTLRVALSQMKQKIRRWRGAFLLSALLLLAVLSWLGYTYLRDHTQIFPQNETLISPIEQDGLESLAAKVSSGMDSYFYDLTLKDGADQFSLTLELWEHSGLTQTWELGALYDMASFSPSRRQRLALAFDVYPSETDSRLEYAISFWGYTWRDTLDDIPYMESGVGWNVLEQPAVLSPENGTILACFSVDPSGQGRWRTPGYLGTVEDPCADPGQAFLLLRLRCC